MARAAAASTRARALRLTMGVLVLMLRPCSAQTTTSPLLQTILDLIHTDHHHGPSSSQRSLAETFGPVPASALGGLHTMSNDPFAPQTGRQPGSHTKSNDPFAPQTGSQPVFFPSQLQSTSGVERAQYLGGGGGGGAGRGWSQMNDQSTLSSPANAPASQPLADNFLSKITALINGPPNPGSGPHRTSSFSTSSSFPTSSSFSTSSSFPLSSPGVGGQGFAAYGDGLTASLDPYSLNGGAGLNPPTASADLMSNLATRQRMRVVHRLAKQLGVKQYYYIHGCEDPALLFSGGQSLMVSTSMAHGCHSLQAAQVCHMVQARTRTGYSSVIGDMIPPHIRTQVESCMSGKALLRSLSHSFPMSSSPWAPQQPGVPECGVLLSAVMDGSSLDPEPMISARRSMLPWTCSEASLGPSGYSYRVCCPGKVQEPTLQEAQVLKGMLNS